jgi:hypothetical protein
MENVTENENLNTDKYISVQELTINKKDIFRSQLHSLQSEIINFCKNMNMFQNKDNFFNLTLLEQFEYNECIEEATKKIKKDYVDLENFYIKCKMNCFRKYNKEEMEEKINNYIESKFNLLRPALPPCLSECVSMYNFMHQKYINYMIANKGIYFELVEYKKNVEKF